MDPVYIIFTIAVAVAVIAVVGSVYNAIKDKKTAIQAGDSDLFKHDDMFMHKYLSPGLKERFSIGNINHHNDD